MPLYYLFHGHASYTLQYCFIYILTYLCVGKLQTPMAMSTATNASTSFNVRSVFLQSCALGGFLDTLSSSRYWLVYVLVSVRIMLNTWSSNINLKKSTGAILSVSGMTPASAMKLGGLELPDVLCVLLCNDHSGQLV